MTKRLYSDEPQDAQAYQEVYDRTYTRIAGLYNIAVKILPTWKTWLKPHRVFADHAYLLQVSASVKRTINE
jgi:hypothetical protein